ncbi:MAG: hypothetical protein ACQESG_05675 [Nanobdellota archaeon]
MQRDKQIRQAFDKIKQEFADHLDAINANTNEIQINHEQLCRLEGKVDKLSERMEEITMMLSQLFNEDVPAKDEEYEIGRLTKKEQEVFLLIYDCDETSYEEIARRGGYTKSLIIAYAANLIAKGVPILKRYENNKVKLYIDKRFKEIQTKHNILNISGCISQKVRGYE